MKSKFKKNLLSTYILSVVMTGGILTATIEEVKANTDTSILLDKPMPTGINVSMKGKYLDFSGDEPPTIDNGRTLVPLRSIFEALGADVEWDNDTRAVTATSQDGIVIKMAIDETSYTVNGEEKTLDVSAQIINSRTFVPVRAVSESLGCVVEWDADEQMVYIIPENSAKIKIDDDLTTFGIYRDVKTSASSYDVRASVSENFIYKQAGSENITLLSAGSDGKLKINIYNSEFDKISEKSVDFELPIFGGFYTDGTNNYIVYGKENETEASGAEVYKLVKYDLDFNKIDTLSINGATSTTVYPFKSGGLSMASNGNELVVHTSRLRYASSKDGLNHQSQITFVVDTDNMKLKNEVGEFQKNHVSHSFNQFVQYDGKNHVLLDHGDAYPRSIVIHKGDGSSYKEVNLLNIPGSVGDNTTNVSIGGLEVSSSNYLVPINKIDFDSGSTKERDVVMLTCDKNLGSVKAVTLQKYTGTDKTSSTPKIVNIDTDKYIVIWEELDTSKKKIAIKYVVVNGEGKATSSVETIDKVTTLSDVQPIYNSKDKTLMWFVNDNVYKVKLNI